jgi:hypothetical protein
VILSNIWHDPGAKTSIWHDPEAKLDLLPEAKTRLEAETWKQKKGFLLAINGRGQKIKQKPGFCFVRKHSNRPFLVFSDLVPDFKVRWVFFYCPQNKSSSRYEFLMEFCI